MFILKGNNLVPPSGILVILIYLIFVPLANAFDFYPDGDWEIGGSGVVEETPKPVVMDEPTLEEGDPEIGSKRFFIAPQFGYSFLFQDCTRFYQYPRGESGDGVYLEYSTGYIFGVNIGVGISDKMELLGGVQLTESSANGYRSMDGGISISPYNNDDPTPSASLSLRYEFLDRTSFSSYFKFGGWFWLQGTPGFVAWDADDWALAGTIGAGYRYIFGYGFSIAVEVDALFGLVGSQPDRLQVNILPEITLFRF